MAKDTGTDTFLYEVRCAGCRRTVGVSAVNKWGVYCDAFCAQDIPAAENEARDAVIEALIRDHDPAELPMSQIGARFGLPRQRIYQIANLRDLRKAVKG